MTSHLVAMVYLVKVLAAWATLVASYRVMNAWLSRAISREAIPGSPLDEDLRNEGALPKATIVRYRP